MPANLATLEAVTKEVYQKDLQEQLNNDVVTLRRIEKTSDGVINDVGGRYVTFPIHTRRNSGIGARHENQALPVAGHQGTAAARVGLKYLYGSVELTGQAIALIDKDYQSFVKSLDLEMNGLKTDLARDQNRQVYGNGNGKIAAATETVSSATVEVDTPYLLEEGFIVDVVDSDGTTINATALEVVSVNLATNEVTVSSSTAFGVGDFFVRTGSAPTLAGGNKEWTGLDAIVQASGILYNINPANEPVWTSNIDGNGGTDRAVSENLFTTMIDNIRTRGGKTTVGFTSLGVRRAYANLLMQQRQFVNTKQFDGGFSGIGFVTDSGEIPIVVDVDHPRGSIHFLNEKEIQVYRESDWSFMDRDGSIWQRKITSAGVHDAYQGTMFQYSELGTTRRNTHGRIDDLIEN